MRMALLALSLLVMTGCMSITTNLAPVNEKVKPVLIGEDCVPIIFGIGFGTATVEEAMRNGQLRAEPHPPDTFQAIKVIRSIALIDHAAFFSVFAVSKSWANNETAG